MSTLTLSRVEQAAVLRHLELQYGRLSAGHRDAGILHLVMTRIGIGTTFPITRLEAFITLRHLRVQRFKMEHDMAQLEERRLSGHDGHLDAAHAALDVEVTILNDVLRRLWQILADPTPSPPPGPSG